MKIDRFAHDDALSNWMGNFWPAGKITDHFIDTNSIAFVHSFHCYHSVDDFTRFALPVDLKRHRQGFSTRSAIYE